MAQDDTRYHGPAWDLSSEYTGVEAPQLAQDLDAATALIARLVTLGPQLSATDGEKAVGTCRQASSLYQDAVKLLQNVETYLSCELSVDARHGAAKASLSRVRQMWSSLKQSYNPFELFLKLTTDELVERYLSADHTAPERFQLMEERKLKEHALSLAEEDLIVALGTDGPEAWGTLYDNLSGTVQCEVNGKTLGLAEAASLSQNEDESVRKAAFRGINAGWEKHEEAVASILNALSGWRHSVYKKRSAQKPMHFLDMPLHSGKIRRETLDAMMTAIGEAKELGQRSLRAQAKLLGKERLGPWDMFAPCPKKGAGDGWKKPTYAEAIDLIATAYGSVAPEMGEFVRMMAKNNWIEGRVGGSKRPGAYCTGFAKSRTPRVYMTYNGGMREVMTLAHELGHAFHSWVMRDLPVVQTYYPMTLAETASIFGETVVTNYLLGSGLDAAARLNVAWTAARQVDSFVLNIPARYEFEKRFYEQRPQGALAPEDFKKLMAASWETWYGDTLSEMDPMFWANKLHFSIADISFYNFPYTFGYLFSLGVYAQRERLRDKFFPAYVELLRETGRMTAEDVAAKHLGADLTKPDFWRQSLKVSKGSVEQLEAAAKA